MPNAAARQYMDTNDAGTSIITDKHGEYQSRAVVLQAKPG